MVSVPVRIAIWRVGYGVIAGFYGPAKPALLSMYLQLADICFFYDIGKKYFRLQPQHIVFPQI